MDVYVRLALGMVARSRELPDAKGALVVLDYAEDGRLLGVEVVAAADVEVDGVSITVVGPGR